MTRSVGGNKWPVCSQSTVGANCGAAPFRAGVAMIATVNARWSTLLAAGGGTDGSGMGIVCEQLQSLEASDGVEAVCSQLGHILCFAASVFLQQGREQDSRFAA